MNNFKYIVLFLIVIFVSQSHGQVVGDFVRSSNGQVKKNLTQWRAARECKKKHSRLPTARELAMDAREYGAVLVEVSDFQVGNLPEGFLPTHFYLIETKEADGYQDSFYYSFREYRTPAGIAGVQYIWSESKHHQLPWLAFKRWGPSGVITYNYRGLFWDHDSARCMQGSSQNGIQ